MSVFRVPKREPSRKCKMAAVSGSNPGVVLEDDHGNQLFVTPKMARTMAKELPEIAGIATGEVEPDMTRGVMVSQRPVYIQ